MDMIKFAALVSWLTLRSKESFESFEIDILKRMIDSLVINTADRPIVPMNTVNKLLAAMGVEGKKIEAIKAYRTITNAGLKESKDAVEKYWTNSSKTF